jgi:hypothetical protein
MELEPNVLHRWLCPIIWQVETKSWVNKTIRDILWNYVTWLGNSNAKLSLITWEKKIKKGTQIVGFCIRQYIGCRLKSKFEPTSARC